MPGRHGRRGRAAQALHTDGELAVFSYRRCVILNGIDTGAMQADLADRLLPVDLALITEEERQAEEDLWPSWREAHPLILGALLDLVSDVMARLPAVRLERKPRMADFARIIAAVAPALDTEESRAALARYIGRSVDLAAEGLSGSPLAVRIQECITSAFHGTSAELRKQLAPADDSARLAKDWPKDGRAVTTELHRIAPALRKLGWTFIEERDSHTKLIKWKLSPPQRPEIAREDHRSSPQPPQPPQHRSEAVVAVRSGDESGPSQDDGQGETHARDAAPIEANERPSRPAADEGTWLARHDPSAPPVWPPCEHEACWNALAGRCLREDPAA